MIDENGTPWCDGCGIEITWSGVTRHHKLFCCQDCADGLVCKCSQLALLEEEQHGEADNPWAVSLNYPD